VDQGWWDSGTYAPSRWIVERVKWERIEGQKRKSGSGRSEGRGARSTEKPWCAPFSHKRLGKQRKVDRRKAQGRFLTMENMEGMRAVPKVSNGRARLTKTKELIAKINENGPQGNQAN